MPRRKVKVAPKSKKQEDKKILGAVKKYGTQTLDSIAEVNMFTEENKVIHFKKPAGIELDNIIRI